MQVNVTKELAALRKLTMRRAAARYADAFGEQTNANNKAWLLKRIAWRLQANVEGDLSERARRRAAELANDADLRLSPPKPKEMPPGEEGTRTAPIPIDREKRLPPPGTVISREYKGRKCCTSLSWPTASSSTASATGHGAAVATAITGQHCNGYLFFRLTKRWPNERQTCSHACGDGSMCNLHAKEHRRGSAARVQLPRRPARIC